MDRGKTYRSVLELFADISDPEFTAELADYMRRREKVKDLFVARMVAQVSQREVARRMGVSASRICRLENGEDAMLKPGEADAYLAALG